jgi:hypothetical protein
VQPLIDNFAHFSGEGSISHDDDIDAFSQLINLLRMRFWGTDHLDEAYEEITEGKGDPGRNGLSVSLLRNIR